MRGLFLRFLRALVTLVPAGLMAVAGSRTSGSIQQLLWLGAGFQLLVCAVSFVTWQRWRQPLGPSVVALYLIALGWMWVTTHDLTDWFLSLAEAILLIVPLTVVAVQTLLNSGAPALRRAHLLAERLKNRKDWPSELMACRTLPDVKAFREALHVDASPALALLAHARPQVRVGALAALEFRKNWRPGQAELVLKIAQTAQEPAIQAAAIMALANVDDRPHVEALTEFLRDPSPEVRRATTEALLWDSRRRWLWIRHAIRRMLADPAFQADGPLRYDGEQLPDEAVADLNAWATEKGMLGIRAALSLGEHYGRRLSDRADEELFKSLKRQLAEPHTAPTLRLELARLLQAHRILDRAAQESLLDAANPAPLRLFAADMLLGEGRDPAALAAVYDIARVPNREMALATAEVAQRRLGVALGLENGKPLPALHTRQAAEVTRRVMAWAAQQHQALQQQAVVSSQ